MIKWADGTEIHTVSVFLTFCILYFLQKFLFFFFYFNFHLSIFTQHSLECLSNEDLKGQTVLMVDSSLFLFYEIGFWMILLWVGLFEREGMMRILVMAMRLLHRVF